MYKRQTVFGIYRERAKARADAARIREQKLAKQVYVTNVHNVKRR